MELFLGMESKFHSTVVILTKTFKKLPIHTFQINQNMKINFIGIETIAAGLPLDVNA